MALRQAELNDALFCSFFTRYCVLCGSHHQFCLSFSLSLLPVSFPIRLFLWGTEKGKPSLSHTRSMVQEASRRKRKRENDCNPMNIWLMTDRLTLTHSLSTLFPVRLFLWCWLLMFRSTGTKLYQRPTPCPVFFFFPSLIWCLLLNSSTQSLSLFSLSLSPSSLSLFLFSWS